MNACVTFGNIFGLDEAVHGISAIQEEDRLSCAIDESCFQVPSDYSVYGITFICFFASLLARLSESESRPPPFVFPRLNHRFDSCRDEGMDGASTARRQFSMDEEDELLQYAIQQSIIDVGSENDQVDIWEALKAQKPSQPNTPQMNRANRSSLPPRPSSSLGLPMSTEEQHLQRYPPHSAVSITRRLRSNTRRSVVSRFSKMSSICLFWACFGPSGSSFWTCFSTCESSWRLKSCLDQDQESLVYPWTKYGARSSADCSAPLH